MERRKVKVCVPIRSWMDLEYVIEVNNELEFKEKIKYITEELCWSFQDKKSNGIILTMKSLDTLNVSTPDEQCDEDLIVEEFKPIKGFNN